MDLLYGKKLGNVYRIDERIGTGGMGSVYRTRDLSLDRDVALKVLHPSFAHDEDFRARFLQEARTIASLDHTDIVRVYAFGEDMGLLYIVMDLVSGQTLHAWLRRLADEHKIVALGESLTIIWRVARALHYAHEMGILHRDIKPANILLKPIAPALREPGDLPFHPVLTDFGLAKLAAGGVHTQTGTTMGTPAYMSPEQCLGREPDRRSDVYSLGVVFFEMVTGRVPFEVKSLTEAIRCHTQEPPPPPRTINATLPIEVENIALRALAKRQEDRFATARQMADALREVRGRVPAGLNVIPERAEDSRGKAMLSSSYESLATRVAQTGPAMPGAGPGATRAAQVDVYAVVIASPDGQSRRVPVPPRGVLTVGRAEDNDLHLSDTQVSRRHARIDFDGQGFTAIDLNSTNGTFLGDSRLLPGIAEVWTLGKPLRLGDTKLNLEVEKRRVETAVGPGGATVAGWGVGAPPAAVERIGVSVETFELSVEPGSAASTSFTILNLGSVVDHFETSVEGIPAPWVPVLPPVVRLLPNEQREIQITFRPPRSPQSKAGPYPTIVRVASQDAPDQIARVRGTLAVGAYYQSALALIPSKQTGIAEGVFEVRLGNQGNADLTVGLEAADTEQGCRYAFEPPQAVVPAGGERSVPLRVRPKAPLPGDRERLYSFTVTARPAEAQHLASSAQGQWVQIPPTFEVDLRPQRQSGVAKGTFQVRIRNLSTAELNAQLEASDPEDACEYAFEAGQVTVAAGQERTVQLEIRPKVPLPGETARAYPFAVTVRPNGALGSTRQAQAQWIQIAPTFEVSVSPSEVHGVDKGTFGVRVANQSVADLEVQVEASDVQGACSYSIRPARMIVPAAQQSVAELEVQAKSPLRGKEPHPHSFTVVVRPTAALRSLRQAQAVWVQLPRHRSLWPPRILTVIGWILAFLTLLLPIGSLVTSLVAPSLARIGIPWVLIEAIAWGVHGMIIGILGGVVTGLALCWAEPSFRPMQILGTTIVWAIGWAILHVVAPLTGRPMGDRILLSSLVWVVTASIIGLACGWITGGVLRRANPALQGGEVFLIGVGWAVAWGAGEFVADWIANREAIWSLGDLFHWLVFAVAIGGVGGIVGSVIMFGQLGHAQRRASQVPG